MYEYDKELLELIPPKFCLAKYDDSKTLSAYSWDANINKRAFVDDYLQDPQSVFLIFSTGWDGEGLEGTLQDYIQLNETNIDRGFVIQKDQSSSTMEDLAIVNPLTLSEVKSIIQKAEEAIQKGVNIALHKAVSEYSSPHGNIGLSCATVNIFAPDEVVFDSFKMWLVNERARVGMSEDVQKKNLISPAIFRRWCDKKVIAYLDLTQWHALRGSKLKKHQIAKILFPNEVSRNPVDIINKSTEKLAKEVLDAEIQHALGIQGAVEKWKDNK